MLDQLAELLKSLPRAVLTCMVMIILWSNGRYNDLDKQVNAVSARSETNSAVTNAKLDDIKETVHDIKEALKDGQR